MTLHTHIEQSRADRGAYKCVVFEIRDRSGRLVHSENTRASGLMNLRMSWTGNDGIHLDSSDIGGRDWRSRADGRWTEEVKK